MHQDPLPFKLCSPYMVNTGPTDYNIVFKKSLSYREHSALSRKLHYHEYYQLYYLTQGSLLHGNQTASEVLKTGDVFIVPPGYIHYLKPLVEETWYYSLMFFPGLFSPNFNFSSAYKFLNALTLTSQEKQYDVPRLCVPIPENSKEDVNSLFKCLLNERLLNVTREDTIAASLISCILTKISRIYYDEEWIEKTSPSKSETTTLVLACIDYIDQHYMLPLNGPELAQRFTVSVSTLGNTLQKLLGMGFKEYLNHKRIEHAAAFLAINSLTVNEVAQMVGYTDTSTFYRNFSRNMKMSPTEYRAMLQKE